VGTLFRIEFSLDLSVFCSLVMFCVNRVRMEQFDLKNEIDLKSKLDSIRTDSKLMTSEIIYIGDSHLSVPENG
jgi:hypothetical protein